MTGTSQTPDIYSESLNFARDPTHAVEVTGTSPIATSQLEPSPSYGNLGSNEREASLSSSTHNGSMSLSCLPPVSDSESPQQSNVPPDPQILNIQVSSNYGPIGGNQGPRHQIQLRTPEDSETGVDSEQNHSSREAPYPSLSDDPTPTPPGVVAALGVPIPRPWTPVSNQPILNSIQSITVSNRYLVTMLGLSLSILAHHGYITPLAPAPTPQHELEVALVELQSPRAQEPERDQIILLENELAAVRKQLDDEKIARAAERWLEVETSGALLEKALGQIMDAHNAFKDEVRQCECMTWMLFQGIASMLTTR